MWLSIMSWLAIPCAIKIIADFFSHCVESHAFGTTDVMFPTIVGPRTEYKQTTSSARIEKGISRFVVIAETIVREENKGALLL